MSQAAPFHIQSGLPFARTIEVTLPNGRAWWTLESQFEVLSQIRESEDNLAPLVLDLSPYIVYELTDPDTVLISLSMTGSDTRLVTKDGYYDIIMSDAFATDARAERIIYGPVYRSPIVTADAPEV
jgi:hypothetical protein